ncbi:hypothetical protein Q7F20_03525 [Curtobacterium sp. A7_M15]|uniref:hypothetical protein n=1 Tax=Curtobacterium sp. A7_M15 TaxID=3065241 RepID=UPI00273789A8|nr:hypothetical protein [Curtobacterium sp. A7_M15]MDP4332428.1 hypothetical protein [Curtobacterium sp. A7_M15]
MAGVTILRTQGSYARQPLAAHVGSAGQTSVTSVTSVTSQWPHDRRRDLEDRGRITRGNITNDQTQGAGVGIALAEAVLEGDRQQVHLIHDLYGTAGTLAALPAAERHALHRSSTVSTDGLFDLADIHQRDRSDRSVAI